MHWEKLHQNRFLVFFIKKKPKYKHTLMFAKIFINHPINKKYSKISWFLMRKNCKKVWERKFFMSNYKNNVYLQLCDENVLELSNIFQFHQYTNFFCGLWYWKKITRKLKENIGGRFISQDQCACIAMYVCSIFFRFAWKDAHIRIRNQGQAVIWKFGIYRGPHLHFLSSVEYIYPWP